MWTGIIAPDDWEEHAGAGAPVLSKPVALLKHLGYD